MSTKPIEIGSTVSIKAVEATGMVTGVLMEQDGLQYRVAYWVEGVRRHEWLYGFELGEVVSHAH